MKNRVLENLNDKGTNYSQQKKYKKGCDVYCSIINITELFHQTLLRP